MKAPDPVIFGDAAIPADMQKLARVLMSDVVDFYDSTTDTIDGRARVFVIMNALAIVSASVVAGTNDYSAAKWFLMALDRNVRAFLERDPPPPGATMQ